MTVGLSARTWLGVAQGLLSGLHAVLLGRYRRLKSLLTYVFIDFSVSFRAVSISGLTWHIV